VGFFLFVFLLINLPEASFGLSKFLLQCLVGLLLPAHRAVETLPNFYQAGKEHCLVVRGGRKGEGR